MAEIGTPNGDLERDDALALALAAGATVREAAERAGVSERTAHRRLGEPAFRRIVSELRGRLVDTAAGRLADLARKAVDRLETLVESAPDTVALGASKAILEIGGRLREAGELEQRITQLETIAERNQHVSQAPARFAGNGH